MKKRILSILLCLCMVMALLPTTALATEGHTHCICGASHTSVGDHTVVNSQTFTEWTSTTALPNAKGYYYLTTDVTLSATWTVPTDTTVLCLNGKKIIANGDFDCIQVTSTSCTLTLCDCKPNGIEGCITHSSGKTGHGVNTTGIFNMYGGTISGNTAGANVSGGGGVYVGGTFNMYGGTISGNTTVSGRNGGGVFVNYGGTFNMSGGSITNNTATYNGGGVYVGSGSTFEMSGGEITGNTASGYGDGGGVFVNYGGTFQMSDDSRITGNTGYRGGGVSVDRSLDTTYNPGAFTMSSGNITDNNAQYGGGVYISGNFTMSGGKISSNRATGDSGGVHMNTDSTFTVSGAPKITGNTLTNDTINNVCLSKGTTTGTPDATITIGAAHLSTGASIGVTTEKTLTTGSSVTIATGAKSGDEKYFTSDADRDYHFVLDGNEVKLGQHEHNWQYTLSEDKTTITATCNATGCTSTPYSETLTISAPEPAVLTYDGNVKAATLGAQSELKSGLKDAAITYAKTDDDTFSGTPTDAGTYTASITVGGKTASVEYTITRKTLDDVAITAIGNQTYTGSAIEPTVSVTSSETVDGHSLVKDTDYTVEYANNTAVGTATVTVTAKAGSNYTFSPAVTENFTITSATIPDAVKNAITGYTGTYDGNPHNAVVIGAEAAGYTVQYSNTENGTYNADMPQVTKVSDSTTVWVEISRDNYTPVKKSVNATVSKATQNTLTVTGDTTVTYGQTLTLSSTGGSGSGAVTYEIVSGGTGAATIEGTVLTATKAGTVQVKAVKAADSNYNQTESTSVTITITKAAGSLTAPTAKPGLVYNGSDQALITAASNVQGGTIQYSLDNSTWSETIPTGKDAKTYTVYYKLVGDANHNNVAEASIPVTIGAKPLTLASATATGREYAAGNKNVVISTVTFSNEAAPVPTLGSGFTASGVMDTDAAGTGKSVTVTVTLTDTNYSLTTNTITTTVDISKAAPSFTAPTAKTLTYNESDQELVTGGSATGGTMKYKVGSGDWTDSIPTGTNAGTYNVYYKVVGDSNHNDTAESGPVTVTISQAALGGNDASKNIRFNDIEEKTITATDFGLSQAGTFTLKTGSSVTDSGSVLNFAPTYGSGIKVQLKSGLSLGSPAQTVTIPVTFTPDDSNYTAKDYTLTITLINKDDVSGNITFNNGELTYTGTGLEYKTATITVVSGGTWTYTYAAGSSPASLDGSGKPLTVGTYTVTATYEDSAHIGTKSATLTITPKTVTAPAADATVFTYNGAAQTYGISATGDYTVTGNVQTAANESGYTVTVTLKDKVNTVWADTQNATDKEYSFVIRKATPTGTPTYTAITTGGKTLGDAALTGNAGWPAGDLKWVQADGTTELASSTVVVSNTSYKWLFTPTDTANYNTLTGSITPYVVSYSGGSYTPPTYKVESEVAETADGSVSFSKNSAKKGDTVTITVTPDRYYKVDGVTVKDSSGKEIAVTDNGDGTFTFKMPGSKVTVEPVFSWDNPFADVAENAYYAPAVEWALKNDITDGVDAAHFAPNASCTRAQIVTFLWRAAGCPAPKSSTMPFTDVKAGSYYETAVLWAVENGITKGTGDTTFSPNATCSRAQIVSFLYRAASSPAVSGSAVFTDVSAGSYYANAVAWAVENGITGGTGNNAFSPNADCTRAQIVSFLYRWMVK